MKLIASRLRDSATPNGVETHLMVFDVSQAGEVHILF